MNATREAFLREQLIQRRTRLQAAITEFHEAHRLEHLINEIDAALQRMSNGSFGICEECKYPIEEDRLLANPLLRTCLDHLTPDERTALEHDLRLASLMQNQLLPERPYRIDGWEFNYHYKPAGPVSGDYCDILTDASGGDAYFILGDVSGKGVSASLMMTHLHALFRSLSSQNLPLDTLMEQANRIFNQTTMASVFATLVCGKLTADGTVEICNAGHCPPVILHKDRHATIEATGIPLAIFPEMKYEIYREELAGDDMLILYTDGISETRNPDDMEFSDGRVVETLQKLYGYSTGDLIDVILKDLKSFRGAAPQSDDETLMVIKRIRDR